MGITTRQEFEILMEDVDAELGARAIPISHRILEAANEVSKRLAVKVSFEYRDRNLRAAAFNPDDLGLHVFDWYKERYGKKSEYDMDLGSVAFFLRGDVWFLRLSIIFDWAEVDRLGHVDCLTSAFRDSLSQTEISEIEKVFNLGYEAFTYLLMKRSAKYVVDSMSDHRSAVEHLRAQDRHPGQSKWASLQATEKVVKAFTASKGKVPIHSHILVEVAKEAENVGLNPVDRGLLVKIQCTPGARYSDEPITLQGAIVAHQSALQVSLLVSAQL